MGAERLSQCLGMAEELWSWFVDRINSRPVRIGTLLLIEQANIISTDLYEDWLVRKARG